MTECSVEIVTEILVWPFYKSGYDGVCKNRCYCYRLWGLTAGCYYKLKMKTVCTGSKASRITEFASVRIEGAQQKDLKPITRGGLVYILQMSGLLGYRSLPPKAKNLVVAGGLTAFVFGAYFYTMRAVGGTDELQVAIDKFEADKSKNEDDANMPS
ncbi:unnamed protein product [Sphenostylis stenocarpa]|uniref:Uncharacterized protein n=1 Tax=Sphenostylis stenocarpa TaxID=92480 RepID=A0AA86RNM2_9FABA|nr:unnamed protein product [Sphenostylis stenocarpa]